MGVSELGHIVENRVVTAALHKRLQSEQRVALYAPATLQSLGQVHGDTVSVTLEDGMALSAHLLVGADGALSRVRELAGFETREWDYGHHALVATVQLQESHQDTAWQRFTEHGPLAFLPLGGSGQENFASIVWSSDPTHSSALMAMDDCEFSERLARDFEHRLGAVLAVSSRNSFPLRQRHATDYVLPGIALVGDAAHTIHPLAGQGINLGLQDVLALSEELLAGSARGLSPGDLLLLQRYQRRRKSDNLLMMTAMDGFKHLFSQRALPVRFLRNTGMRMLDHLPGIKHRIMRHAMGLEGVSGPL
jgi:2-octaprenylphenol hydroxylase